MAFGDASLSSSGDLIQVHHDCTPDELHLGFRNFWATYWQRSPLESTSIEEWPAFQALLARYPCRWQLPELDLQNFELWDSVLRKMKPRSATGACGFSVQELKSLPTVAIRHLARLFGKATVFGLPDFLLRGRVNVLAKIPDPQGYGDGRPICVLPVLYRAWTSVFCQALL